MHHLTSRHSYHTVPRTDKDSGRTPLPPSSHSRTHLLRTLTWDILDVFTCFAPSHAWAYGDCYTHQLHICACAGRCHLYRDTRITTRGASSILGLLQHFQRTVSHRAGRSPVRCDASGGRACCPTYLLHTTCVRLYHPHLPRHHNRLVKFAALFARARKGTRLQAGFLTLPQAT